MFGSSQPATGGGLFGSQPASTAGQRGVIIYIYIFLYLDILSISITKVFIP